MQNLMCDCLQEAALIALSSETNEDHIRTAVLAFRSESADVAYVTWKQPPPPKASYRAKELRLKPPPCCPQLSNLTLE